MTICFREVTKLQFKAVSGKNRFIKIIGIRIDIYISKNVYICIIKILNHVGTFN